VDADSERLKIGIFIWLKVEMATKLSPKRWQTLDKVKK